MNLQDNIKVLDSMLNQYNISHRTATLSNDGVAKIGEDSFDKAISDYRDSIAKEFNSVREFTNSKTQSIALNIKQYNKITNVDIKDTYDPQNLFYGMRDISKSNRLVNLYKKFPYFNIILSKAKTKFDQRVVKLLYNCDGLDDNTYYKINDLVEQDVQNILNRNQYDNLSFFLTHILYETILYGISFIYFDEENTLTTLDQGDLRVLYNYNGITYNPTNYLSRIYLTREYWETIAALNSLHISVGQETSFISMVESNSNYTLSRLSTMNFSTIAKNTKSKHKIFNLIDAKYVHPAYFYPYEKGLYIVSPIEVLEEDITEYLVLNKILKETQNANYGSLWFIKIKDLASIKSIGNITTETLRILKEQKDISQSKLVNNLNHVKHNLNSMCVSDIVDGVEKVEKDSSIRDLLLKELDRVIDRIIDSIGETGYVSKLNNNKRNENINSIEAEDFYTGLLHSYDTIIKKVYKHFLRIRLQEHKIKEEQIDYVCHTLKLKYVENAVLTLEDQLKMTQILSEASKHLTSRELRHEIGFNYNSKLEELRIQKEEAEIESMNFATEKKSKALANKTTPENQHGKKNPSNATINK